MKFKAYIKIQYRKRKLLKPYIISKALDRTHAKKILKDNLAIKLPGRIYNLISLTEIE